MSAAPGEPPAPARGVDADADAVLAALSAHYDVSARRARSVRRRQLDTFDWRLADAGLHLVHERGRAGDRLLLVGGSPGIIEAPGAGLRWPLLVAGLPPGALRDAVAPLAGIRAIVVHADRRVRVRTVELRNEDAKVVCRLELADTGAGSLPEVELLPLRGYEADARRAGRLLGSAGVVPGAVSDGRPERSGRAVVVDPSGPAVALLGLELRDFLDSLRANVPGTVDDVDTEFLHDLRVAVRRTRSTLKLGRPVLPRSYRNHWEPWFKRIGDLTTPLRDLDVYQLDLPTMTGWLVAADPSDLDPFAVHLARRRTTAYRSLARELRAPDFGVALDEWEAELVQLPLAASRRARATSASALAHDAVRAKWKQVATGGRAITDSSPPPRLHELRKRLKELRYALEVFGPALPAGLTRSAMGDVKRLQDVLGRYQDTEVQRVRLRTFADEMLAAGAGAATVLAMGELVAHLDAEQQAARAEFRSAFARFDRAVSRERFRRLGGRG